MTTPARSKILCVDDEPQILEGLKLGLGRKYEVSTATSGAAALEHLAKEPDTSVIVSDMRMPIMDGATLLAEVRTRWPDITRLLLTGHADFNSAIAAVNHGQIFRFLQKPCPQPQLQSAIDDAVAQYRLVTGERELLEKTLFGSIQALADVMAIASPLAFGRATRIRRRAAQLAEHLKLPNRWQIEIAALLSHLGYITIPQDVLEKVSVGHALSTPEQTMLAKVPQVTESLLHHIPRLEGVRAIIAGIGKPYREGAPLAQFTSVVQVALDFDALEASGHETSLAFETLLARDSRYDPDVLGALNDLLAERIKQTSIRELPLAALRVGMTFAEEVRLSSGALLAPKGYEITASFIARMNNQKPGVVREPLLVQVPIHLVDEITPYIEIRRPGR